MGVINVRCGNKGMQKRLDGRPRLIGAQCRAQQIVDHLGVVHRVAFAQRKEFVQAKSREAGGGDRREIGTRAFDPQHARSAPDVVEDGALGRGIPPTLVCDGPVSTEEV